MTPSIISYFFISSQLFILTFKLNSMSGHSHWSGIKHKKELTDAKKGKLFTKVVRLISISVRAGGPDPDSNPTLRLALEKAKEANMPKANIDRAIEKASGKEGGAVNMEEVSYEAFGPGGVAMIIQGVTDNKNRAVSDIKKIVVKHGGRMAEAGSVSWMFEAKSKMRILPPEEGPKYGSKEEKKIELSGEELELAIIDAGADDVKEIGETKETKETLIYCAPDSVQYVRTALERKGILTSQPEIEMIAKQTIAIDDETQAKIDRTLDELEDCDDANEIFLNC